MFKTLSTLLVAAGLLAASTVSAVPAQRLISEELVTTTNVYSFANRAIDEAARIWATGSNNGWTAISTAEGILNEGMPVSGFFADAGVNVTRATGVVNAPAQTLFDYLITPQGYQLIDPTSNPEDFSKPPLETFSTAGWRGASSTGKRLEVARTEAELGEGVRTREFVVLNAIDATTRLFVSKSVQHKADPGCSMYGAASCYSPAAVPVRALNMFAVQVTPMATNASQSVVQLINYADLTPPEIPAALQNLINAPFLPQMIARMRAAYP